MKIAVAADHGGFALKSRIIHDLTESGNEVSDLGTNSPDPVDYPDYARAVAEAVLAGRAEWQRDTNRSTTCIGLRQSSRRFPSCRVGSSREGVSTILAVVSATGICSQRSRTTITDPSLGEACHGRVPSRALPVAQIHMLVVSRRAASTGPAPRAGRRVDGGPGAGGGSGRRSASIRACRSWRRWGRRG